MAMFNSYVKLPEGIGNFIIPNDEVMFFRGVGQLPTRIYKYIIIYILYIHWSYLFDTTSPDILHLPVLLGKQVQHLHVFIMTISGLAGM